MANNQTTTASWTLPDSVKEGDIPLILIYVLCGGIGTVSNVLAVIYFFQSSKKSSKYDLSSSLYMLVALVDVIVSNTHIVRYACRKILSSCRKILPSCRKILSSCRKILSSCRKILLSCRKILYACRKILSSYRKILSSCRKILSSCRKILSSCRKILSSCVGVSVNPQYQCLLYVLSYQHKLIKMRSELTNLNHCAVPVLSRGDANLS